MKTLIYLCQKKFERIAHMFTSKRKEKPNMSRASSNQYYIETFNTPYIEINTQNQKISRVFETSSNASRRRRREDN